jgi:hypothetical protein
MIQYSLLGRTAASIRQTLYSNELTRLCAREDYIIDSVFINFKHTGTITF